MDYEQIRQKIHKKYKTEIESLKDENWKLRNQLSEKEAEITKLKREIEICRQKADVVPEALRRFCDITNAIQY